MIPAWLEAVLSQLFSAAVGILVAVALGIFIVDARAAWASRGGGATCKRLGLGL